MKWIGIIAIVWSIQLGGARNGVDLIELAKTKGIRPHTGSEPVFLFGFTRQNQYRESLLITAGASFQTDPIPVGSRRCVSLLSAMPFNLGDGATLRIWMDDGSHQTEAAGLSIDPAHIRAQRSWIPLRFDIPADAKTVRFKFEVGPGARDEGTADWVGLASGPENACLFGRGVGD